MTEGETEEKDSQADHDEKIRAEKRTRDSKSLPQKGATKASVEGDLEMHTDDRLHKSKELMATL